MNSSPIDAILGCSPLTMSVQSVPRKVKSVFARNDLPHSFFHPDMSSSGQINWNELVDTSQGLNPSMLQQPFNQLPQSPATPEQSSQNGSSFYSPNGSDVSQSSVHTNSSLPSFATSPTPIPEESSICLQRQTREEEDKEDKNVPHMATLHLDDQGDTPPKIDLLQAIIFPSSAAATPVTAQQQNSETKHSISKVVISRLGEIDGPAYCACAGNSQRIRHLCPFPGCNKHFSTGGHARRHSRIHGSSRPFQCPYSDCDATFTRRDNCSQHQKGRHGGQLIAQPRSRAK